MLNNLIKGVFQVKRKVFLIIAILIFVTLIISACGDDDSNGGIDENEEEALWDYNGENFAISYPDAEGWEVDSYFEEDGSTEYEVFKARYDISEADDAYHELIIKYQDSGPTVTEDEFADEAVEYYFELDWMDEPAYSLGSAEKYCGVLAYEHSFGPVEDGMKAYYHRFDFYHNKRHHYIMFVSQNFEDSEAKTELGENLLERLELK